jgi:primosomal protein N' (replication factor Y) (superfamily II helicase)
MNYAVLLPKIFNHPLTYKSKINNSYKIGDIVEVPFGKKKEVGVIWDSLQKTSKKINIRSIEKKITDSTINKNLIKYINWFSVYNIAPKGLILKMCIGNKPDLFKEVKIDKEIINSKKKHYSLNSMQKNALIDLEKHGNKFSVSVLQGVTGSGKTIVYFERIKKLIKENKQVLVLFPEIFLTNQFKTRFLDFFGFEPAIWHSKITPKNKRRIWQGIIKNNIKLVIGARSALLLPFKNLGLIIVDEEHDPSYKQEDGIIYNARDMAIARASTENVPINLITSIPSLETYNNIKNKKYNHTLIKKRFNDYPLPQSKVINLNLKKINNSSISEETINIVKDYLEKKNQVLFFLNRRGYSPFLICKECGFKHSCPNCSIYLTYHKISDILICHHCGHKIKKKNKCKKEKKYCVFSMYGPGVEKVLEELKIIFPNKNIKIFSSDYLSKKKEEEEIFKDIESNKIDILVGTQMISKGFNFPKLNCIVVVDADFSGKGYDLRTTEKNIQLYNQLSGRAGRFSFKSMIIYQTVLPTQQTLNDLIINNPEKFLENELNLRKNNNLPPFRRLIAIIVSAKSKADSFRGAQEIKKKILDLTNLEVLGPVDSPIYKLKKNFRTRLLIRSQNDAFAQKIIAKTLNNLKISSKIKLTVDVDPINFA